MNADNGCNSNMQNLRSSLSTSKILMEASSWGYWICWRRKQCIDPENGCCSVMSAGQSCMYSQVFASTAAGSKYACRPCIPLSHSRQVNVGVKSGVRGTLLAISKNRIQGCTAATNSHTEVVRYGEFEPWRAQDQCTSMALTRALAGIKPVAAPLRTLRLLQLGLSVHSHILHSHRV